MDKIDFKLQKDILINIISGIFNTISAFLLIRLVTGELNPVAFGLFMLIRRYSNTISTFSHFGGSPAQIRYMGMFAEDKGMCQLVSLSIAGLFIFISIILLTGAHFAENKLCQMLLPDVPNSRWILWLVFVIAIQQLLHFNVVNNLIHKRQMILYNLYKLMNASGIFLLYFLFGGSSSNKEIFTFYIIAGGLMLITGQVYYNLMPMLRWRELPWQKTRWLLREIVTYGIPRSPVNLLGSLIFVIGPWLIRNNLQEVGYLLTIYFFIRITEVIIFPINQLVMVVSARQLSHHREKVWERGVNLLFGFIFIASTILVVSLYPWMDALFQVAISSEEISEGIARYSILISCIVPLSVFHGLKGFIEMRWKHPVNLFTLLTANIIGIVFFFWLNSYYSTVIAIVIYAMITFWLLGVLTAFSVRTYLKSLNWIEILKFLGLSLIFLATNLFLRHTIPADKLIIPLQFLMICSTVIGLPIVWWLCCKPKFINEFLLKTEAVKS